MILHIGMPKTGSTALQVALARDGLLANTDGKGKRRNWGRNVAGFAMDADRHVAINASIEEIPDNIVVSDEDLCLAEAKCANALLATIPDALIVVVNRPFNELAESWWAEQVKHGETRPFPLWFNEVAVADPRESVEARRVRIDYACHSWSPNIVMDYSRNLLDDFARRFLRGHRFSDIPHANSSLSMEATEALRIWQLRNNASWMELQNIVGRLLWLDRKSNRGMSLITRVNLLRYDNEIRYAINDGGIAQLKEQQIVLRQLDTEFIEKLIREIEATPCIESGRSTASAQATF